MLLAFFSGIGEIKYVRQSVHEESQERSVSIGLINQSVQINLINQKANVKPHISSALFFT